MALEEREGRGVRLRKEEVVGREGEDARSRGAGTWEVSWGHFRAPSFEEGAGWVRCDEGAGRACRLQGQGGLELELSRAWPGPRAARRSPPSSRPGSLQGAPRVTTSNAQTPALSRPGTGHMQVLTALTDASCTGFVALSAWHGQVLCIPPGAYNSSGARLSFECAGPWNPGIPAPAKRRAKRGRPEGPESAGGFASDRAGAVWRARCAEVARRLPCVCCVIGPVSQSESVDLPIQDGPRAFPAWRLMEAELG